MVRSLAVLALVVSSLALPRGAAAADPGDGAPLRTICSSVTMDYCWSFWTWEFVAPLAYYDNGTPTGWSGRTEITAFGSGYDGVSVVYGYNYVTALDVQMSTSWFGTPGEYTLQEIDYGTALPRAATISDIQYIRFARIGDAPGGLIEGTPDTWYEVPEPGSLLLLTTGLAGVAYVRRRRAA